MPRVQNHPLKIGHVHTRTHMHSPHFLNEQNIQTKQIPRLKVCICTEDITEKRIPSGRQKRLKRSHAASIAKRGPNLQFSRSKRFFRSNQMKMCARAETMTMSIWWCAVPSSMRNFRAWQISKIPLFAAMPLQIEEAMTRTFSFEKTDTMMPGMHKTIIRICREAGVSHMHAWTIWAKAWISKSGRIFHFCKKSHRNNNTDVPPWPTHEQQMHYIARVCMHGPSLLQAAEGVHRGKMARHENYTPGSQKVKETASLHGS